MEGFLENLYDRALERWCEMRVIVGAAVYPSREDPFNCPTHPGLPLRRGLPER